MVSQLDNVIQDFKKTLNRNQASYCRCLDSFSEYVNESHDCSINSFFEKEISIFDIEMSCCEYFRKSKRSNTIEAIHRYLTSIDIFYKECLKKKEIKCKLLESGCRKQKIVDSIVKIIGPEEVKVTTKYSPLTEELKIIEEYIQNNIKIEAGNFLMKDAHLLQGAIIFKLCMEYGFKSDRVINFRVKDFNTNEGTLSCSLGEQNKDTDGVLNIKLPIYLANAITRLNEMYNDDNREFLFVKASKGQLSNTDIFTEFGRKIKKCGVTRFTPTAAACTGIKNLIVKRFDIYEIVCLSGVSLKSIFQISMELAKDNNDFIENINNRLCKFY